LLIGTLLTLIFVPMFAYMVDNRKYKKELALKAQGI
jgi:hypothetical protein